MIVCICKKVSDRRVLEVAQRNNGSVRKVCDLTGACTDCGSCGMDVKELCRRATSRDLDIPPEQNKMTPPEHRSLAYHSQLVYLSFSSVSFSPLEDAAT